MTFRSPQTHPTAGDSWNAVSRREFLGGSLALAATLKVPALAADAPVRTVTPGRKIKLGVVGCGGRGSWIAGLFHDHGGYDIVAVGDYFQLVADQAGDALGIPAGHRFSGLSAHARVMASGIEALALEVPPFFFPDYANAAVDAGLHVYMAKPVAADAPGCMKILAASQKATAKKQCFRVDYQMPTDPVNQDVAARIRDGGLGRIAQVATFGVCTGFPDPPKTATIESRLQHLTWVNDIALGCDFIGNFDIHAIDAALWVLGHRPVAAVGGSRVCRPNPHGDSHDVCSVVFEYADGTVHNHFGQGLADNVQSDLTCKLFGDIASAELSYWGRAYVRGGPKHFGGAQVDNLYQAGAQRNIAAFYEDVLAGNTSNDTPGRAVDSALACILGREAASRQVRLTMDELIHENKRLDVDLTGLKA